MADSSETHQECVICLSNIDPIDLHTNSCKHTFHRDCIQTWWERSIDCPLCRQHQPQEISLVLSTPSTPIDNRFVIFYSDLGIADCVDNQTVTTVDTSLSLDTIIQNIISFLGHHTVYYFRVVGTLLKPTASCPILCTCTTQTIKTVFLVLLVFCSLTHKEHKSIRNHLNAVTDPKLCFWIRSLPCSALDFFDYHHAKTKHRMARQLHLR